MRLKEYVRAAPHALLDDNFERMCVGTVELRWLHASDRNMKVVKKIGTTGHEANGNAPRKNKTYRPVRMPSCHAMRLHALPIQ